MLTNISAYVMRVPHGFVGLMEQLPESDSLNRKDKSNTELNYSLRRKSEYVLFCLAA
jgi:hypothetical protein